MNRIASAVILFFVTVSAVMAASQSGIPPKFPVPWGNTAGSAYIRSIPLTSQIGTVNCAASLPDGFPPLTFVPSAAGGCPPFGQDFNGILKQITQWSQWQQMGASVPYDSGFSASIGGYPKGVLLSNASIPTCYWSSTVDNNTSDPDTGGANWTSFCATGGAAAQNAHQPPGGRLTNVSGTPVISPATCALSSCLSTSLYFAPYGAGANPNIPVFNGTQFLEQPFTTGLSDSVGLTLALDSNPAHTNFHAANNCFDVFYAYVSGTLYFGTGPAWGTCVGSAGVPARSAAIAQYGPVLTNTATMVLRYGNATGSTISVPAHQATWLGSVWTDSSTAGQVDYIFGSLAANGGQALFGIWNYFNRVVTGSLVQDSNMGTYNINGSVASNFWIDCDHSPTTRVSWIAGLPEDTMHIVVNQDSTQNASSPPWPGTFYGIFLDADAGHTDGTGIPSSNTLPNAYGISITTTFEGTVTTSIPVEFPGLMGAHFAQCVAAADGTGTIATIFNTSGVTGKNYPIFGMSANWRN